MMYTEENFLPISGIQHIAFCERQFALIHIERQWEENLRTVEGRQLHDRVDDPEFTEARGGVLVARSMPLVSRRLGLWGVADVVEFIGSPQCAYTVRLNERKGFWVPKPIEYKRGKPKHDDCDIVQLCAQALCVEEMLGVTVGSGDIFYGETRHRINVPFDSALKCRVEQLSQRMHYLFDSGITPPSNRGVRCNACSLVNLCMPQIGKRCLSASDYLKESICEECGGL